MVFLALTLLLAAPSALAPPRVDTPLVSPKVGILPVVGGARISAADRDHLRMRSRAALLGPGLRVAEDDELEAAERCTDQACRRRSLAMHGVSYWLTIEIGGRERMYTVRTKLWSVEGSEPLASTKQRCVVCGRMELAELVAAQAWDMRRLVSATADDPAVLVVDARPAFARVEIDAAQAGRGHLRAEVPAGKHEIHVSAPGYAPQTQTLTVTRGMTRSMEVVLVPSDGPVRWHRPLAIGALAAATLGIGAGAALVAIDGRAVGPRCGPEHPDDVDADGDCRYIYQTLGGGVAMTAVGVGLASAAVTLLVIDTRRRHRGDSPARLHIDVGPGHVGLAGRF